MSAIYRMLFILAGASAFALVAYIAIGFIGQWYEQNMAKNDDDLTSAYIAYLAAMLISAILGGWIGDAWYRKKVRHI